MATNRFEVDTDLLRRNTAELRQNLGNVKKAQEDLQSKMAELGGMWKGPAKDTFHLQFQSDCVEFADLCKQISEILDCMDNAAKEYDICDERVRGIIDAIKV